MWNRSDHFGASVEIKEKHPDATSNDLFKHFASRFYPASRPEFLAIQESQQYKDYFVNKQRQHQLNDMAERAKAAARRFAVMKEQVAETDAAYNRMMTAVTDHLTACLCAVPYLRDDDITRLAARFLMSMNTRIPAILQSIWEGDNGLDLAYLDSIYSKVHDGTLVRNASIARCCAAESEFEEIEAALHSEAPTMSNFSYNQVLLPAVTKLVRLAAGCDVLRLTKRNYAAVSAMRERFSPAIRLHFVKRSPSAHYKNGGAGVWASHKEALEDWCLRHRRDLTDCFDLDEDGNIFRIKPGATLFTAAGLDP